MVGLIPLKNSFFSFSSLFKKSAEECLCFLFSTAMHRMEIMEEEEEEDCSFFSALINMEIVICF